MLAPTTSGIVQMSAAGSVDEVLTRLLSILQTKAIQVFAVIDHSGEAEKVGLQMPNTKLVIFGNPQAGTPLMLATPSIALDLPLKILIAQGADGRASISYNSPAYLQTRHEVPSALIGNIAGIEQLVGALVQSFPPTSGTSL